MGKIHFHKPNQYNYESQNPTLQYRQPFTSNPNTHPSINYESQNLALQYKQPLALTHVSDPNQI